MRSVVTGCAGFVGSHLVERLLAMGHEVAGIDTFTDYYPRPLKEHNMAGFRDHPSFSFVEADLATADLTPLLSNADTIFHLAAQAGVRASWGQCFDNYTHHNVLATQRVLEATPPGVKRVVFASSSSIYGDVDVYPTREDASPRPTSPYGVTKLACEHLCRVYFQTRGVPVVWLRYFSLYGPRQRPDMAFHIFARRALEGKPLPIFGDGQQTRDFTFVADAVEATIAASTADQVTGRGFNIGGGSRVSLEQTVTVLERIIGHAVVRTPTDRMPGDARHTGADLTNSRASLGYVPTVSLEEGLRREVEWVRDHLPRLQQAIP